MYTQQQMNEYIDDISEYLDNGDFEAVYNKRDPRNEQLTDMLYDMGIDPLEAIPEVLNHIAMMEAAISTAAPGQQYTGERLYWLIEGYGSAAYRYLYLYQFKHNPAFRCENVARKYSWYQDNDNDYYIAMAKNWDISKFYKAMDAALAEE